jgi:hypothetical protein
MYWLVSAMYPRFLITLDEQLEEKAITVRVGQAVNTVGLAGQRMGISGVGLGFEAVCSFAELIVFLLLVPNPPNTRTDCRWRAGRIWNKRILPLRINSGGNCHHQEERLVRRRGQGYGVITNHFVS